MATQQESSNEKDGMVALACEHGNQPVCDSRLRLFANKPDHKNNRSISPIKDHSAYIRDLKLVGSTRRADRDQPKLSEKPTWFDASLFENAKSVYARHFMATNFAHLSGLLLLVRVNSIYNTLSATGQSDNVAKLFKRYYGTLRHVKSWYEGDIFDEKSEAHRMLLIVRGMHNKVSSKLNDCRNHLEANNNNEVMNQTHISEYDIMITQFAFIGFIVTNAKNMGFIDDFSRRDLLSLIHFWRLIGYYLGASDELNLCSYELDDVIGLCNALITDEYRSSIISSDIIDPPGIMSVNIVRAVKFIPMMTVYGMMKYLYELLNLHTEEIEERRTWYSNLSYTLIKLVMSNLLGYNLLRAFNNGLTRLSIYSVGKVEDWFERHLKSKYGLQCTI